MSSSPDSSETAISLVNAYAFTNATEANAMKKTIAARGIDCLGMLCYYNYGACLKAFCEISCEISCEMTSSVHAPSLYIGERLHADFVFAEIWM